MIEAALKYLRAGLCVLPAVRAEKRPAVPRWKEFQRALPGEEQLAAWCRRADALCLVCGAVSGNLEM
ncbi:MAG TPA: bifunctional DNA primase/polymerase, partial [Phycisphaerae bacterium]|nr:bifunctional DNA primase/polymerase [Phycisphaerae bacterium]